MDREDMEGVAESWGKVDVVIFVFGRQKSTIALFGAIVGRAGSLRNNQTDITIQSHRKSPYRFCLLTPYSSSIQEIYFFDIWPGQPDRPQFSASSNTGSCISQRSYIPASLPRTASSYRANRNRRGSTSDCHRDPWPHQRVSHPAMHHATARSSTRCLPRTSPTGAKTPYPSPPSSPITRARPQSPRHGSSRPSTTPRQRYYCV